MQRAHKVRKDSPGEWLACDSLCFFLCMIYAFFNVFIRVNGTNASFGTSVANGTVTGNYLYWNATTSAWTVGSNAVNLGANALASGTGAPIAIGDSASASRTTGYVLCVVK